MASTSNFKEFFFWSPQSKDCCFVGKWYYTGKIIIKFWFDNNNNSGELTLKFKTTDEIKCIEHLTQIQKEIEKHGSVMVWCGNDLQSGKTTSGKM